jgi:hypothetical protein
MTGREADAIVRLAGEIRRAQVEEHAATWEHDVGLTNTTPRRRTEPAITVPRESQWDSSNHHHQYKTGDIVEYDTGGRMMSLTVSIVDHEGVYGLRQDGAAVYAYVVANRVRLSTCEHIPSRTFTVSAVEAFTPAAIEAIVTFGSDRYASQAMVCDEARVVATAAREREAEETSKREYVANGNDPVTAWDFLGSEGGDGAEYAAQYREWKRNLPKPLPHETPGDWARRCGAAFPCYDRAGWEARVRLEMAAVERGEPVT